MDRACEFLRICDYLPLFEFAFRVCWCLYVLDRDGPAAQPQCDFYRLSQSLSVGSGDTDPVYPDVDVVTEVLLEFRWIFEVSISAIHTAREVSLFHHGLEQVRMGSLSVPDDGGPDCDSVI